MIRVLIDAVGPAHRPRGVGRYITRLANSLANDDGLAISLASASWQLADLERDIDPKVDLVEVRPLSGGRVGRHLWHQFALGGLARRVGADLIHLPDTLPPPAGSTPVVATLHDLAEFDLPEVYSKVQGMYRRRVVARVTHRADALITVSEFSRHRIESLFPASANRVIVIPNGPGISRGVAAEEPPITISERFFLFVGGMNRNKNLGRLIDAFITLERPDVDLILLGPEGNDSSTVAAAVARAPTIKWLERGSDAHLAWLLQRAEALIMPSLYEGFGLPIIEAMTFGTPVIASQTGAPAEVVGGAGMLIDPLDPKSIRLAMATLLADADLRDKLATSARARGAVFSWNVAAIATAREYRAVIARTSPNVGR